MSECETCGGFVTDNYARVFGDNENRVHECRHCPPDATRSTDEETDERQVLLRDVRGGGAGDGSAESPGRGPTDGTAADGDSTDATTADRAAGTGPDDAGDPGDAAETDTRGPVNVTDLRGSAADDGGRGSGLSAFLSALRS